MNSYFNAPPEVHKKKCHKLVPSYDIWSLGCIAYEMLSGEILMYDYNDPNSIQVPETCSDNLRDFLACCLEYDPESRATISDIIKHPFLDIEEKTYQESHEAINFISLYGLVAQTENPEPKRQTESVERLSILQKRSKYQARDSILSAYKVTPELSKALGIEPREDKRASLKHINIGMSSPSLVTFTALLLYFY